MDKWTWEEHPFEELSKEEAEKEYAPPKENPYVVHMGELARFVGVVGCMAALMMLIGFVGPDAVAIVKGWTHGLR